MSEPTINHTALAEYVIDANEVLRFKMVTSCKAIKSIVVYVVGM